MRTTKCYVIVCTTLIDYMNSTYDVIDVYLDDTKAYYATKVLNARDLHLNKKYKIEVRLLHIGQ